MRSHLKVLYILQLLLAKDIVYAQVMDMTVFREASCRDNSFQYVINTTVDLQRPVKWSDHLIWEIAEPPRYQYSHYFDVDIEKECFQPSFDETTICTQERPNIFNIVKTVKSTEQNKGAKIRGFLTGESGNTYCDEKRFLTTLSPPNDTVKLEVNGEELPTDKFQNLTYDERNLKLQFSCGSKESPCLITIKLNNTIVYDSSESPAVYTMTTSNGSESRFTIEYCSAFGINGLVKCLIKTELKGTREKDEHGALFVMYNSTKNPDLTTGDNPGINGKTIGITFSVVGAVSATVILILAKKKIIKCPIPKRKKKIPDSSEHLMGV